VRFSRQGRKGKVDAGGGGRAVTYSAEGEGNREDLDFRSRWGKSDKGG